MFTSIYKERIIIYNLKVTKLLCNGYYWRIKTPTYNKKEFLKELENKSSKHFRKKKAYSIFLKLINSWGKDKFDYSDFAKALSFMNSVEISLAREKEEGKDNLFFSELTFQDILTSEFLLNKITPHVEEVRKKIFGSPKAPFDWNGAVEWIENEAKKPGKNKVNIKELKNKLKKLSKELSENYKFLTLSARSLPYQKKNDEWLHRVNVNGPKLFHLENETRSMAKAAGFSQPALVIHVLTGIKPLVPRVDINTSLLLHKLSEQETLSRREINLKIRAKDFTFRELQRIYRMIRKEITLEKGKTLKQKHLRIYNFIRELGKPPSRGELGYWKFWNNAQKKWNEKYPDDEYKSWQGIRKTYESTMTELEKHSYSQ